MRQAIVTGATGFIGSVVVSHLTNSGYEVISLGRRSWEDVADSRQTKLSHSQYVQIDMCDIAYLGESLSSRGIEIGSDSVFYNFAWWGEEKVSDLNVNAQLANVERSLAALTACSELGIKRFVQVGSMEEEFAKLYLSLDHNKHSFYNRHLIYALAKLTARRVLYQKSMRLDIEFIYGVNSHVMGPDDEKDSFLQVTLQKLKAGAPLDFSSGEQFFDVIDVVDCARAYECIGAFGRPSTTYWVGSGSPRPLRQYVEEMFRLYPSKESMNFGAFPFNDVRLEPEVFSIRTLSDHTGYKPSISFEESVRRLWHSLQ